MKRIINWLFPAYRVKASKRDLVRFEAMLTALGLMETMIDLHSVPLGRIKEESLKNPSDLMLRQEAERADSRHKDMENKLEEGKTMLARKLKRYGINDTNNLSSLKDLIQ